MAVSLCRIAFVASVLLTSGNCADVSTTLTTTPQSSSTTLTTTLESSSTTTTTPSSLATVSYPYEIPNICSLPCGKEGHGCNLCSDTVFSCTSKQLTAVCPNYFNQSSLNVTVLDLDNNDLKDFRSFPGKYPKVLDLKLSSNKITKVTKDDLARFPALKKLDLSHNELLSLPEDLFEGLPDLEELLMHSIGIYTLPENIFRLNMKLHFVDLQGNKLHKFPRDIFKPNWHRMTSLIINENPIDEIVAEDFAHLQELKILHMERLDIVSLNAHTFASLDKLLEISLDHNSRLTFIHEDAFGMFSHRPGEMAVSLEKASIRACGLQSLDKHVFDLRNMKELGLSGNPWQCDCTLKWLVSDETQKLVLGKDKFKSELEHTNCQDLAHRGIPISMVPDDHFVCVDQRMRDSSRFASGMGGATTVLVITFLLCIIAIIFAVFMFRRSEIRRVTGQQKNQVPTSVSQYRAIYNQGNVQTHEDGFVNREKDPFEI